MYKLIAIAGTFDRLHKGHKYFIKKAFSYGEKVMIGITSDRFVKAKISNFKFQISNKIQIQNFQKRKRELEDYLKSERLLERAVIVKIDDVYGPAISLARAALARLEALVVTEETYEGGLAVNRKRDELGLPFLKLLKLPMILAQDDKRIASTRIRMGEIDRWGRAFAKQMQISNFQFPISNELRQKLKKPLGKLIKGDPGNLNELADQLKNAVGETNSPIISTVGDEVTRVCIEAGIEIQLAIVDLKVNRIPKYSMIEELGIKNYELGLIKVNNPPGHISKDLVEAVKDAYMDIIRDGKQRIIKVDGEEDLAGVPAVLLAPLGSVVIYGQPGEGVVVVEVAEEKKAGLFRIMKL